MQSLPRNTNAVEPTSVVGLLFLFTMLLGRPVQAQNPISTQLKLLENPSNDLLASRAIVINAYLLKRFLYFLEFALRENVIMDDNGS